MSHITSMVLQQVMVYRSTVHITLACFLPLSLVLLESSHAFFRFLFLSVLLFFLPCQPSLCPIIHSLSSQGGLNTAFEGDLDEVRIWKRARTDSEILSSMHRVAYSSEYSSLVAYYPMDTGGSAMRDVSGNGLDIQLGYSYSCQLVYDRLKPVYMPSSAPIIGSTIIKRYYAVANDPTPSEFSFQLLSTSYVNYKEVSAKFTFIPAAATVYYLVDEVRVDIKVNQAFPAYEMVYMSVTATTSSTK